VFDLTVLFGALEVTYDIRSSELQLVMSTQWLRPTLWIALAQV
jgi:hypothetical protein